ncbi:hypothetical protein CRG98_009781, partial [Punica granatum]
KVIYFLLGEGFQDCEMRFGGKGTKVEGGGRKNLMTGQAAGRQCHVAVLDLRLLVGVDFFLAFWQDPIFARTR